jgi:hypothetical protein
MLRNIPNKYTPDMLRSFLDQDFLGEYDFFYLRMVLIDFDLGIAPLSTLGFQKQVQCRIRIFKLYRSDISSEVQKTHWQKVANRNFIFNLSSRAKKGLPFLLLPSRESPN